jgi:hypothetical protein
MNDCSRALAVPWLASLRCAMKGLLGDAMMRRNPGSVPGRHRNQLRSEATAWAMAFRTITQHGRPNRSSARPTALACPLQGGFDTKEQRCAVRVTYTRIRRRLHRGRERP